MTTKRERKMIDWEKPYAKVYGCPDGRRYCQNGVFYNNQGKEFLGVADEVTRSLYEEDVSVLDELIGADRSKGEDTPVLPKFTRETLEHIAGRDGMTKLREYATALGVTGRSSTVLIERILKAQAEAS